MVSRWHYWYWTNNRKVVGSMPANVVCITALTGRPNRLNCSLWPDAGHHSFFRAVGSWSFRLSALMDSDLAWVNVKSGRQS